MKILVINGPNINMLGIREPEIYGSKTLKDIENEIKNNADKLNIEVEFFQSNSEGSIVDKIQNSYQKIDGIIINPAAYTHTSVAIRDAISGVGIPTVEVHLSNINSREDFRHNSFIAPVCIGQIAGFSSYSYIMALYGLHDFLKK